MHTLEAINPSGALINLSGRCDKFVQLYSKARPGIIYLKDYNHPCRILKLAQSALQGEEILPNINDGFINNILVSFFTSVNFINFFS